jgi:nitrogen fixation protein NifB
MNINNHPCFNVEVRHRTGRIHLPVAPLCNVQCNFCDRKFDCTNESRPGVSSGILKPSDVLDYLGKIQRKVSNIAVVGIAGPGDPFANPKETMETLELVHARYPDKLLCISSNGLSISEYIPRLAELNVSHVTITLNAIDPMIGAKIYEWVHFNKKTYFGLEGATILFQRQIEAIKLLKHHNITIKINTVVIPRVNEYHIPDIASYVSQLGADVQNCIPLIPVEGTPFGQLGEPSPSNMRVLRAKTSIYISQMAHCVRCRADAVGLLVEDNNLVSEQVVGKVNKSLSFETKPYIAIGSTDGVSINQHLGEAKYLWIYSYNNDSVKLVERRSLISTRTSNNRWNDIANTLNDCSALLVNGIGRTPLDILTDKGLFVEATSGLAIDSMKALFSGNAIPESSLRLAGNCGIDGECSGSGRGCS